MEGVSIPMLVLTCVFAGGCGVIFALCTYAYGRKIYAVPNDKLIQINIDRNIFPFLWFILLTFMCVGATIGGVSWSEKQMFLKNEEVKISGWMGRDFLKPIVVQKEVGSCGHVAGAGAGEVIYVATEEEGGTICGISHEKMADQASYPFIVLGEKSKVMIGDWPFSYELTFETPPRYFKIYPDRFEGL